MRGREYLIAGLLWASSVATAEDIPICPDRPSKANGTCTVPAGSFQLEAGLVDWTQDRSGGVRNDLILWGSSFVKYGLSESSDVEIGFTPWMTLRERGVGENGRSSGFGDVTVRVKQRLTSTDEKAQATVIPFVKLPTAGHDLGNGKVEGGVAVPVSAPLGKNGVTLAIGPEIDLRTDADGHGYHLGMVQLVNLGIAASDRLSLSAELWSQWDWDSGRTTRQESADGSIAYLVTNDLQLDAGANFGLNRNTPDVEVYAGVSKRF